MCAENIIVCESRTGTFVYRTLIILSPYDFITEQLLQTRRTVNDSWNNKSMLSLSVAIFFNTLFV